MNRTSAAALVTTAVIGITAGAVTAVVRGDDPGGKTPTADPTTSRSSAPEEPTGASPQERVLWADGRFVHDGEKRVGFPGTPGGAPDRLVRAKGGYVLAFKDALYFVPTAEGTTQFLARGVRTWDLSPAGDQVVVDLAGNIQVVGLDGVVTATRAGMKDETTVLWEGAVVTVHGLDRELGYRVWTWDPATGELELTDRVGFAQARADRTGRQVVGAVDSEGLSGTDNSCVGTGPNAGRETATTWFTCDWRLNSPVVNPMSPTGARLLVIHRQSDGFGPGGFGVVDVAEGPSAGVPTISAPEDWMMEAAWVDDDHFAMVGANSDEVGKSGGWLYLSDTEGNVEEIARTTTGRVVIGEQF